MSDYISREAALVYAPLPKYLREYQTQNLDDAWEDGYFCALDQIKSIPAADVRPVVTCGECKYWELSKIEPSYHVCTYVCGATFVRNSEDFCSRGEKREEI